MHRIVACNPRKPQSFSLPSASGCVCQCMLRVGTGVRNVGGDHKTAVIPGQNVIERPPPLVGEQKTVGVCSLLWHGPPGVCVLAVVLMVKLRTSRRRLGGGRGHHLFDVCCALDTCCLTNSS